MPNIPRRLRNRPVYKGMPVPANTMWLDGVPDFATIDQKEGLRLSTSRKCALCGQRMRGQVAFIASSRVMAAEQPVFRDGPMHEECARYSFEICPMVSGEHMEYRADSVTDAKYKDKVKIIKDNQMQLSTAHDPRVLPPVDMMMLLTDGWELKELSGMPLYVPSPGIVVDVLKEKGGK